MSQWKAIWNNREAEDVMPDGGTKEIFIYLKSLMGTSARDQLVYSHFRDQFESNLIKMNGFSEAKPRSYFEVGCGSGMYLYYLGSTNEGLMIGGIDYSTPLIEAAGKVLCTPYISALLEEFYCDEAIELDTRKKYDCVYSRSVFQYFQSEEYGMNVAEKMLEKANHCVAIFDLFDPAKKKDFLAYRRSLIENYDEKYADTPHQFYHKEDFLRLADRHNCDILFTRDALPEYWNEQFVYDVYLYKRH